MCDRVVEFLKTVDQEKLHKYASDLVVLYQKYDQLSPQEKGELIGHAIGRYGTDLFMGFGIAKGVSAYRKLKEANRICNFEALASSAANKKAILKQAEQLYVDRTKFFANRRIDWSSQEKHIPGKNRYENLIKTKKHPSTLRHNNPKDLLDRKPNPQIINGRPGDPRGYKEVCDWKEYIGDYSSKDGKTVLPTTRGTIHYKADGRAHIVPAHPDPKYGP